MPILEFITSVISAVVGAVVTGIIHLFTARRASPTVVSVTPPPQPLLAVAPGTLVQYGVPLTERTRDILRIPRAVSTLATPPLIVPGEGLVSPHTFLYYAMDSLVIRAEQPVACSRCGRIRRVGAFINNRWLCLNCLRPYLEDMTEGRDSLFRSAPLQQSSWNHVKGLLSVSEGPQVLEADPTIRSLLLPAGPRRAGEFRDLWLEHDVPDGAGGKAIRLHFSYTLHGYQGVSCRAVAFFYFESGVALRDYDGHYRTKDGDVSVGGKDTVMNYPSTRCDDWMLLMPVRQLHLARGDHQLKCLVEIYSYTERKYVLTSDWAYFNCTMG